MARLSRHGAGLSFEMVPRAMEGNDLVSNLLVPTSQCASHGSGWLIDSQPSCFRNAQLRPVRHSVLQLAASVVCYRGMVITGHQLPFHGACGFQMASVRLA